MPFLPTVQAFVPAAICVMRAGDEADRTECDSADDAFSQRISLLVDRDVPGMALRAVEDATLFPGFQLGSLGSIFLDELITESLIIL